MNNYTEEELSTLVKAYERKKIMEHKRYESKKNDPEFIKQNRARAKAWYHSTKPDQREKYEKNKEYYKAKSSYKYYVKVDKINTFIQKFPERVALLNEKGYAIEKKPDPSIFVSNDSSSPEEQSSSVE